MSGWGGKSVPGTLCVQRSTGGSDMSVVGKALPLMLSGPPATPPPFQDLVTSLALRLIHGLVHRLLNATFKGYNLTCQTHTIQTLAFKLGCDFAGLSLDSDALDRVPQVRDGQDMGGGRGLHPRNPSGV